MTARGSEHSRGRIASDADSPPTSTATGTRLAIAGLRLRYPGQTAPALAGVDLAIEPGEVVAVAGRNGAGKSSLALAAAGFIPRIVRAAVAGSVKLDGIDALRARAAELAGLVGIVFSTPANQLSGSKLTVREELAFGLENLGLPRAEMDPRIDRVMHELGIAHLAEREPLTLSGGEQQRVAIASILVMEPRTVILDEPTAQLDPAGAATVAAVLSKLAGGERAVLVAEHGAALLGSADRCLVLDAGRAVCLDVPGRALSSARLTPLGLRPPTIIQLAELAGLANADAPDTATVAAAIADALARGAPLGRSDGAGLADALALPEGRAAAPWQPIRDHPPTAIEIEGLVHRYPGGVEAVRGVSLTIPPGQRVAIVGQNGSGKTTLVKHLNGLLRPDAGEVRIGGTAVGDRPVFELARTVGFVFQDPDDQLFNRTVERELRFGPTNLRLPPAAIDRLVEAALAATGLAERRTVNPYDLGLSERKLVALASVLAMDPAVIVLDEPTTGQDGPGVARIGAVVDGFAAAGRTVVAITHDMEFAAEHFERIVVMRAGEVVLDGSPAEVFAPEQAAVLASTGLEPPVAARVGAALGLGPTP
ncbi:MAG TPA: ABC transporter ATP-binding protein, partial [Candidatus Limnocylindrales bacterium]|nr:ABC transporter ATP-binding protein [Candidatus Limnocylindrales bacterium]